MIGKSGILFILDRKNRIKKKAPQQQTRKELRFATGLVLIFLLLTTGTVITVHMQQKHNRAIAGLTATKKAEASRSWSSDASEKVVTSNILHRPENAEFKGVWTLDWCSADDSRASLQQSNGRGEITTVQASPPHLCHPAEIATVTVPEKSSSGAPTSMVSDILKLPLLLLVA